MALVEFASSLKPERPDFGLRNQGEMVLGRCVGAIEARNAVTEAPHKPVTISLRRGLVKCAKHRRGPFCTVDHEAANGLRPIIRMLCGELRRDSSCLTSSGTRRIERHKWLAPDIATGCQ